MKPIISFFILLLLCTNSVISQKVVRKGVTPVKVQKKSAVFYNLGQLNGKWQEVLRTNPGSAIAISFTDTMLIHFKKNKVEIRDGISMNMNMKGDASIDPPNILNVAGDVYRIRSLSANTLVIDDGDYIRRMQRKNKFHYETLGKDSITAEKFEKPLLVDVKELPGKWLVYRRQAAPGAVTDENLIKSISINSANDNEVTGEVVIYNADVTIPLPAKFIFNNGTMKIVTDKITWDFNTYKANGKEFVFGNEQLLYYSKPL